MHLYIKILTLVYSLLLFSAQAQIYYPSDTLLKTELPDTILTIPKNRLINGGGIIFAINMGVWSFDRYITGGDYTNINWNTVKSNFRTGFVWDNDMFMTNLFAHPYHGGIYFNAARSNGLNFWQSVPFAAGGSLVWEFFMENEPAAINDFLATSIGGACLGEMTYRISDRIIDDRTVGFERFKREALITLISPATGLSRLISGDATKRRNIRGNSVPTTPITFFSAIGYRIIADNLKNKQDISNMMCFDLGLYYGNPYDPDNEKPYDFFMFKLGGNIFSKQPVISRVNALGVLFSRNINLRKPNHQLTWGLFQHFNYYQSKADIDHVTLSPYKLSEAASLGPGLLYKIEPIDHLSLLASAYLSAILLGGSQTDHFNFDERDYNMGSGFSSKLNLELQFGSKIKLTINSEDYRIYSWVGYDPNIPEKFSSNVQGDIGSSSLSVARMSINYIINKQFLFGAEASYYYRKSHYKYYPDVEYNVEENKLSLGYIF